MQDWQAEAESLFVGVVCWLAHFLFFGELEEFSRDSLGSLSS